LFDEISCWWIIPRDICTLVSIILHSAFYYILWKTWDAINDCPKLPELGLPNTGAELREASVGFEGISFQGITMGYLGATVQFKFLPHH
jgi:hypothetical protein